MVNSLRKIQDVGREILTGNPEQFYVFIGTEYGVKERYLSILKSHYNGYKEADSVKEVLDLMSSNHLIPLQPKLYIVRYDEDFIQSLSDKTTDMVVEINPKNIIGTIVCLYELPKHVSKCVKYLDSYTVAFDSVNTQFIKKYLSEDFPGLDISLIESVVSIKSDYRSAYNICNCLSCIDPSRHIDNTTLDLIFGDTTSSDNQHLKLGIASRNFQYMMYMIDNYTDDLNNMFYAILSTCIELEKVLSTKSQSDFRQYAKVWTLPDVYNMFMSTYAELEKSRNASSYDTYGRLVYLFGLMQFSPIPTSEVMI